MLAVARWVIGCAGLGSSGATSLVSWAVVQVGQGLGGGRPGCGVVGLIRWMERERPAVCSGGRAWRAGCDGGRLDSLVAGLFVGESAACLGVGWRGESCDAAWLVGRVVVALAGTGRRAEMPSANAAPVSTEAALRCRLRRRRCLVSTGLNSIGYASNTDPLLPCCFPCGLGVLGPSGFSMHEVSALRMFFRNG